MAETLYCTSKDGTRIAYDITGNGPVLVLLHGIGKTRLDWHKIGYVDRLSNNFTVITVDIRGYGESDYKLQIDDYTIKKICNDITTVVNASGFNQYSVLGYSFGGNIARYLGVWSSDRIISLIIIGVPFGPALDEEFDQYIDKVITKYGSIDISQKSKIKSQIPAFIACIQAMRKWSNVDYNQIKCPTLLLFGTQNKTMVNWFNKNSAIKNCEQIRIEIIEKLNHQQEFTQINNVFPIISSFVNQFALTKVSS